MGSEMSVIVIGRDHDGVKPLSLDYDTTGLHFCLVECVCVYSFQVLG